MILAAFFLAFGQAPTASPVSALELGKPAAGRLAATPGPDRASPPRERFEFTSKVDSVVGIWQSCDFDAAFVLTRTSAAGVRVDSGGLATDAWASIPVSADERVVIEVLAQDGRGGAFELTVSNETRAPRLRADAVRAAIARWGSAAEGAKAAGDSSRTLACSRCRSRLLAEHGPLSEARTALQGVIALAGETGSKEAALEARIDLAVVDRLEGHVDAAAEELERLSKETSDPTLRRLHLRALDGLGCARFETTRLALARTSQEEQLRLARELGDKGEECLALLRLGTTRSRAGEIDGAEDLLRQALELARGSDIPGLDAKIWLARGWHDEELGRFREAYDDYRRALDLDPNPLNRVDILGGMGNALFALHEITDSKRWFDESQDLAEALGISAYAAKYLLSLGNLEIEIGELDIAVALLEKARAIWSAESHASERAQVLLSLAHARQSRAGDKDFEAAAADAREAIQIGKKLGDLRTEVDATILLSNGPDPDAPAPPELRTLMEDLEKRASSSQDLEVVAKAEGMLAWDDFKRGRDDAAIAGGNRTYEVCANLGEDEQCLEALDTVARAALHKEDVEVLARALDRAVLLLDRGEIRGADPLAVARTRSEFAGFEGMAHDLLALRLRPADLEKSTVARWTEAGFESAGAWKARSLVDSLIRQRSRGPPQESEGLRAARATLAQARERLGVLARLRAEDPLLQEEYRKVTRARQSLEELERTAEGGAAGDRTGLASRGVSPGIARTALHDDRTALIEFAAGVRNLYAYVLTRDHLELLNLGDRRPIEEDARCFLSLLATNRLPKGAPARISADVEGLVAVGRSLYASLLAKALATAGPKVDHLIVVPTTELADMPFEALIGPSSPDSGTGFGAFGFVVRKYTILYAPSSPALVELGVSTRAKRAPSLMIFADPVYPDPAAAAIAQAGPRGGSGDSADPMRGMELDSLGYTRSEASQIASLFSSLSPIPSAADALAIQEIQNGLRNHHRSDAGFELFLGPEATPRRFRENAGRCTILHVAAHGCRSTRAYADPILALSPDNGGNSALTCQQILQLDLNADLVVLAACDTARGRKIDGDGIQSLARAFLHAGARDVVASLWAMKDPAVGGLMIRLYRQLLKGGLSRADALHQVKLDMLTGDVSRGNSPTEKDQIARFTDSSDPGLWAAFVILGAPE